jgi:hypothetical protein
MEGMTVLWYDPLFKLINSGILKNIIPFRGDALMSTSQKTKSVPFFNYPFVFDSQKEQFLKVFQDVGARGAFILQKDLSDFEQHLAEFCGCRYALGMAMPQML